MSKKKLLCDRFDFMDDKSNLGCLPFAIHQAQEILGKWRDDVRTAVEEGEEQTAISKACQP
jgi:hypothetical protein